MGNDKGGAGRVTAGQAAGSYTAPTRLNATGIKELATLQPDVAQQVKDFMTQYRTRKVTFASHPADYRLYMAEGAKLTFYAPNGNMRQEAMVSENTIGAANTGFNYAVNQMTPPLPEGTWIFEEHQPYGGYSATVHYVGLRQIRG